MIPDAPWIFGNLCAGQAQTLSSVVENQGDAGTGSGFTTAFEFADSNRCSADCSAIPSYASDSCSCDYTPPSSGSQTIYAIADKPSVITESNEGNNQSPNFTVNFLSSPGTPGTPSVSGSPGDTTVSWSDVSGEANYDIWRNTSDNFSGAVEVATDRAANSTSWTDTSTTCGNTYYFWIEATNSCTSGTGPRSANSGSLAMPSCYTYSWYTSSWSSCSGFSDTCDESGTETRDVYCQRSDGQQVDDSYCSGSKPASSQSCTRDTDGQSCSSPILYCADTSSCDTREHERACVSGSCSTSSFTNDASASGSSCSGQSCGPL